MAINIAMKNALHLFDLSDLRDVSDSNNLVVMMRPRDFLYLASPIPLRVDSAGRTRAIRSALNGGSRLETVPWLNVEIIDGEAVVHAHDGRHRSMELERRGFDLIPVLIVIDDWDGETVRDFLSARVIHPQPADEDEDYEDRIDRSPVALNRVITRSFLPSQISVRKSLTNPEDLHK